MFIINTTNGLKSNRYSTNCCQLKRESSTTGFMGVLMIILIILPFLQKVFQLLFPALDLGESFPPYKFLFSCLSCKS